MYTKIVSVSVLCLGLIYAGYLFANQVSTSNEQTVTVATDNQPAPDNCCKQKLACCGKEHDKACCVAMAKLACCAKGMKCCTDNAACCTSVQDCCRQGLACCNESKACCGKR